MRPGLTTATQSSGLPLPLPIRVSAGFLVTGLSGKMRMKIFPPRLTLRASDTRAASIWRLVIQPGSSAFNPNSPKESVEPRCAFRYLTRLGINMDLALGRDFLGGKHLALEDPDLHPDGPEGCVGLGEPVVDVGPDRVQRHPAVAIPLPPRDLGPAQPARARDPDAVRAQPQRGGHRLLHR